MEALTVGSEAPSLGTVDICRAYLRRPSEGSGRFSFNLYRCMLRVAPRTLTAHYHMCTQINLKALRQLSQVPVWDAPDGVHRNG